MSIAKQSNTSPLAAIIPAAGNSGRMGTSKALLAMGHGMTFARHLVDFFRLYGCNPVALVVNDLFDSISFHSKNLKIVLNQNPEKGRSWSIHLGLKQVPEGYACFIQNIDNPFLDNDLLDKMLEHLPADGYAVPVFRQHGGHPVLIGSKVADFFRNHPDDSDFRKGLLQFTRVEVPFPDERILWNINTPDDYQQFLQRNRNSHKKL